MELGCHPVHHLWRYLSRLHPVRFQPQDPAPSYCQYDRQPRTTHGHGALDYLPRPRFSFSAIYRHRARLDGGLPNELDSPKAASVMALTRQDQACILSESGTTFPGKYVSRTTKVQNPVTIRFMECIAVPISNILLLECATDVPPQQLRLLLLWQSYLFGFSIVIPIQHQM